MIIFCIIFLASCIVSQKSESSSKRVFSAVMLSECIIGEKYLSSGHRLPNSIIQPVEHGVVTKEAAFSETQYRYSFDAK